MDKWLARLSFCVAIGVPGGALWANEATWEHNMDVALQAAARQDYALSETAFAAAIRDLELMNPGDPRLGPTINSLGLVYRAENKLPQAEATFRRALAYIEKTNSSDSIDLANANLNVGSTLVAAGKYNLAEPFLQKALKTFRKQLGDKSPKTAKALSELGEVYRNLQDYAQAEPTLKQALDIQEAARGIDDPDVAITVNSLAELYAARNQNDKAEPLFKLVMSIRESTAGMDSPEFANAVERYAAILEKIGRFQEAARHKKLAAAVKAMLAKKPAPVPVKSQGTIELIPAPSASTPAQVPQGAKKPGNTVARVQ